MIDLDDRQQGSARRQNASLFFDRFVNMVETVR